MWSEWTIDTDEMCFEVNKEWKKGKHRSCSNPEPQNGGSQCEGTNQEYIQCLPSK